MTLAIGLESLERSDDPEVRMLKVRFLNHCLSAGIEIPPDGQTATYRDGPYLDPQPLALWLMWNWWRLNWEPESTRFNNEGWHSAHSMLSIGEGWLWPRITIYSDGVWVSLNSDPSPDGDEYPVFKYIGTSSVRILRVDFELAVDEFLKTILGHPDFDNPDLPTMWEDLSSERSNQSISQLRKFEALLGLDPDDHDREELMDFYNELKSLGENATEEVALDAGVVGEISAPDIRTLSGLRGFDIDLGDGLSSGYVECPGSYSAKSPQLPWKAGYDLAREVRSREGLHGDIVSDKQLSELLGTSSSVVSAGRFTNSFSWILAEGQKGTVALHTRKKMDRRFALARLLGDRLLFRRDGEALLPATRSHSYRQKFQRAFAAEFLSPWDSVKDQLGGHYSPEKRDRVADYFCVSSSVIDHQFDNHASI